MAKAAPKPQELNINLLQKEEVGGAAGELIKWVLTVGRYLIIVTEIIALGTFAFGIKLSADKNDLKGKVTNAKVEVDVKAKCDETNPDAFCEDNFLALQTRINQIKLAKQNQFKQGNVLAELLTRLPNGVHLTNLSVDGTKINFNGSFTDSVTLQTLIISFSASEKIVDLDIQELTSSSSKDSNYTFKAVANIVPSAFKTVSSASRSQQ